RRIVLALDQVARALPALRRARRVAPWRAGIVALAGRELEEQRCRRDRGALRQLEDAAELLVRLLAMQEAVLRDGLVVVAGGQQHAVHAELRQVGAHLLDLFHRGLAEHRRVRAHAVAAPLAFLYHRDGAGDRA